MNTILMVIAGIVIRLAVPVLLTSILVGFLRRLDAFWQNEARTEPSDSRQEASRPAARVHAH